MFGERYKDSRPPWKWVIGYEGKYEVHPKGEVRSVPRSAIKDGRVNYTINGYKVLKNETTVGGYKRVILSSNGKARKHAVHRLVAECFLDPPEKYLLDWAEGSKYKVVLVNHIDKDKGNNSVDNLEWCNAEENVRHAMQDKTSEDYYQYYNTALREDIRNYYVRGSSTRGCKGTGIKFGVSTSTVMNIVNEEAVDKCLERDIVCPDQRHKR